MMALCGLPRVCPGRRYVTSVAGVEGGAAKLLQPLLGPVEDVRIVEVFYRPAVVVEDGGAPEPLTVAIQVSAPFHVIDVDEAWAFAGHDTQRWTLFDGKRVVLPVAMAARFALKLRCPEHPQVFTRGAA